MQIINQSIQYQMETSTGNTTSVVVGLHGKSDKLEFSANLAVVAADLEAETTFDDLSKKQLSTLAIKKLPKLMPTLAYSNYQFFVQNDVPVRLTAYSDLSNNGSYISLSSTLDQSDFTNKAIESVGYEDVKSAVKTILSQEFPTS
ncbi:hypothetical protein JH395_12635 [Lactiplantibacillus plantarum]|uniref:Lipoprotein n=1 Tax=Lactiplantibacillus plantarum TaxID=1590 RepID=A0AAX1K7N3_LACPN|nr:hypothetical protein [Lactiplantibacillus plantarum]QQM60559.1 hypothetical protein JH395_12635 [Lactiplantibacillus plantarum]WEZ93662.1 hypothetical protein P3T69_10655 [Lactiplantibacillus plantarum]